MPVPRPTLTFHVGVSGHRDLQSADESALAAAALALFTQVRRSVEALWTEDQATSAPRFAPEPPILRCLCGLAEGADSLFAEAALATSWELAAILPFSRDEFARDFAGAALVRYRSLLERAATVTTLEGRRGPGETPYAAVGDEIVAKSDLLVVVWDGLPPRGPGGTGDVVAGARRGGVPVAALPASGPVTLQWITPAPATGLDGLVHTALSRRLAATSRV